MNWIAKTLVVASMLSMHAATAEAKTIVLGLDLSNSSPLSNQNFANRVAQKVADEISSLKAEDKLILRAIGLYSERPNSIAREYTFTRRLRSGAVAAVIKGFIISIPNRGLANEGGTSLLGFMANMGSAFNCADDVHYILVTDAIEVSPYINISKTLTAGKKTSFPALKHVQFPSCDLSIYGIGYGWSAIYVDVLKDAVYAWAEGEKFNRPRLLNSW